MPNAFGIPFDLRNPLRWLKTAVAIGTLGWSIFLTPDFAQACRPSAKHKYPTLKENFARSKSVFIATIKSVEPNGRVSKLNLQVVHAFKGQLPTEVAVTTNESSSCDRLGYELSTDVGCLFFRMADGNLLSNFLEGESSFCIPKNSPRFTKLREEYDSKFGISKP